MTAARAPASARSFFALLLAAGLVALPTLIAAPPVSASSVITSPRPGGPLNDSQSIEPSPVQCGFAARANPPFTFAPGFTGTAEPAVNVSLPKGSPSYFYVGSDAGGNPLTGISWHEDLSVTAAYSGNKSISIGQSPLAAGSFSSGSTTNVAIAGLGVSGYHATGRPVTAATSNGTSVAVTATTGPGDLLLVAAGGEGAGLLHQGGTAMSTLVNVTYSECGSNVIASAAMFAAFLPPGQHRVTVTGATYGSNGGTAMGAVAYVLAPGQPAHASPGGPNPTFSLQMSLGAGPPYTVAFFGDDATYQGYLAAGNSPLLADATYLANSVEPVTPPGQPPPAVPIYAARVSLSGAPVPARTSAQLIDSAFLWAYGYVNDAETKSGTELASTFQDLAANEASQQAGIALGSAVDLLSVFGPLLDDLEAAIGDTDAQQVSDVISVLGDVLSGAQAIDAHHPAHAAAIMNCLTAAGIALATDSLPGSVIIDLVDHPLAQTQRDSLASCLYSATDSGQLSDTAQTKLADLLGHLQDNLAQAALSTGVSSAAASGYSFLTVYFGRQLTFATAGRVATSAFLDTAVDGFAKAALPLSLAQTLIQAYIEPSVQALHEEVDLQAQGADLGTQLTADTAQLSTVPINADLAIRAAQESGALYSLFALWATADSAYQSTLAFPSQSQEATDQALADAAGGSAEYLLRFEEAATALSAGLPGAKLATSPSANGHIVLTGRNISVTATGAGTAALATYGTSPPVAGAHISAGTEFFDVAALPGSSFTSVEFSGCGAGSHPTLTWYEPSARAWVNVTPATALKPSVPGPGCVVFTVSKHTSPSIAQLAGTFFALHHNATAAAAATHSQGLRILLLAVGGVITIGCALLLLRRSRNRAPGSTTGTTPHT